MQQNQIPILLGRNLTHSKSPAVVQTRNSRASQLLPALRDNEVPCFMQKSKARHIQWPYVLTIFQWCRYLEICQDFPMFFIDFPMFSQVANAFDHSNLPPSVETSLRPVKGHAGHFVILAGQTLPKPNKNPMSPQNFKSFAWQSKQSRHLPDEPVEIRIPACRSGYPTPDGIRDLRCLLWCAHIVHKAELSTEMVPMLSPEMIWWNTSLCSAPTSVNWKLSNSWKFKATRLCISACQATNASMIDCNPCTSYSHVNICWGIFPGAQSKRTSRCSSLECKKDQKSMETYDKKERRDGIYEICLGFLMFSNSLLFVQRKSRREQWVPSGCGLSPPSKWECRE